MKIYVFVLLIVAAVAFALPFDEDEDLEPVPFDDLEFAIICSIKRVEHSACAAQCIFKGRTGGSCKKGVCHCRKEKLKWKG